MTKRGQFRPRSASSSHHAKRCACGEQLSAVPFLCRQSTRLHPDPGVSRVDVHQTICTVDIAGYGGMDRTRPNYVALRAGMYASVEHAFDESGIPWAECFQQDVGDSILVLAPPTIPKGAFAGPLPTALRAALCAHNEAHPPEEQIQLRLALHAGEVTYDRYGVAAQAIIHACRLLNAQQLKDELASSSATLAMIVSDWFYTDVIRHHPEHEPDAYRRVKVAVKETSSLGWIRLPGHELPPEPAPPPEHAMPSAVFTASPVLVVPILRPASPQFYEVVDALEEIPCMQNEHTRSQVVDQLRFAGMIRYFASRRAHVTSILRTCLDFEDGVVQLCTVISQQESRESAPLQRLLKLLTGGAL